MRFAFVAAIYLLALTSANAETATTLSAVESEHPHWFTEPEPYRPCPASIVFPGGSCLSRLTGIRSALNCNDLLASATFVAQV